MNRSPCLNLLTRSGVSSSVWTSLVVTFMTMIIYDAFTCADAQAQDPSTPEADDSGSVVTQDFHQRISPALRWTHEGVWQPPKSELSVGLTEVRWAPLRWLNINTWTLPWTVGGANIGAHVSLFSNERWAVSADPGGPLLRTCGPAVIRPRSGSVYRPVSCGRCPVPSTRMRPCLCV